MLMKILNGKNDETKQVLEQAIDAVVSIDENNHVTFFNAAAESLWGYRKEEVIGENSDMIVLVRHSRSTR